MSSSLADIGKKLLAFENNYTSALLKALRVEMDRTVQKNFETQGRGTWLAKKRNDGRAILTGKTGQLQRQTVSKIDFANKKIYTGNTLVYGPVHQFGATIKIPEREVKIRKKRSGQKVFSKRGRESRKLKSSTIIIPARPYIFIPEEDYANYLNAAQYIFKRQNN